MSDDSLFREVDEAIRQEQLKKLWDKYGVLVVGAAVAIVVGVGGYKGWVYWQGEQAKTAGSRFVGGMTHLDDGNEKAAKEVFTSLAEDGPAGYRTLSKFRLAGIYAKEGKKAEAVKLYDELAGQSGLDKVQKEYAQIQAAALRVDEAPLEEMHKRLDDLAVTGNQWRHSARELLGLTAYRLNNRSEAERYFNVIISDAQTPANMRRRAEMMLSLLVQDTANLAPESK